MKTVLYDKLVRDRMQDVIREDGNEGDFRYLLDSEVMDALMVKLREEVEEFIVDRSMNEMADVFEVLWCIGERLGINWKELDRVRSMKDAARGSFRKGLWLGEVRYLNAVTNPNSGKEYGAE